MHNAQTAIKHGNTTASTPSTEYYIREYTVSDHAQVIDIFAIGTQNFN